MIACLIWKCYWWFCNFGQNEIRRSKVTSMDKKAEAYTATACHRVISSFQIVFYLVPLVSLIYFSAARNCYALKYDTI